MLMFERMTITSILSFTHKLTTCILYVNSDTRSLLYSICIVIKGHQRETRFRDVLEGFLASGSKFILVMI
jgi:hypothetical protein